MSTFRDLMTECLIYEHSAEHFNLMKECSELKLTTAFISDQQYMLENSQVITGGTVVFTEGYLHESCNEDTMKALTEKADTKAGSIKEKIVNGCKKVWKHFMNFLMKITVRFDKLNSDAIYCRKKLKKMKENGIDPADLDAFKKIIDTALHGNNPFPVASNQPFSKSIDLPIPDGNDDYKSLNDNLAAALSTDTVVARCTLKPGIRLSCDDIIDASASIGVDINGNNLPKLKGVIKTMEAASETNKQHGIFINADTRAIEKNVKMLEKIIEKVEAVKNENIGIGAAAMGLANGKHAEVFGSNHVNELAEYMEDMNKCYSIITTAIGESIKMYTSLNEYRSLVINSLKRYIDSKKGDNQSNKQDKKQDNKSNAGSNDGDDE